MLLFLHEMVALFYSINILLNKNKHTVLCSVKMNFLNESLKCKTFVTVVRDD